ncbi:N-alpha-acetyltransferase 50 [Pancytospora epiphaga]|nr:N-alpha-acetyltransferase 50 [Pancytospora epiphaga]
MFDNHLSEELTRNVVRLVPVQEDGWITFKKACLRLFPVEYSNEVYKEMFVGKDYYTFFIMLGSIYAGVCSVHASSYGAYLLVFGVCPELRGKLIGTRGLRLLEEFLKDKLGITHIWLHVHSVNMRATRFYLSNGYILRGIVNNYYMEISPQSAHALYKEL